MASNAISPLEHLRFYGRKFATLAAASNLPRAARPGGRTLQKSLQDGNARLEFAQDP
jgi:hypothetical protein